MLDFGFYNMDCMKALKDFPDKYCFVVVTSKYADKITIEVIIS